MSHPEAVLAGPAEEVEAYSVQLEALQHVPQDIIIVGSMGRIAIVGGYVEGITLPIQRPNGAPRDIDVVALPDLDLDSMPAEAARPYRLDNIIQLWLHQEGDRIFLVFPPDRRIAEEVRAEVFQPVERRLGEVGIATFSAQTQQHVNRLIPFARPKDRPMLLAYDEFMTAFAEALEGGDALLPAEFYEPFKLFWQAIHAEHPEWRAAKRVGLVYHKLPPELKVLVDPIMRRLKQRILHSES